MCGKFPIRIFLEKTRDMVKLNSNLTLKGDYSAHYKLPWNRIFKNSAWEFMVAEAKELKAETVALWLYTQL